MPGHFLILLANAVSLAVLQGALNRVFAHRFDGGRDARQRGQWILMQFLVPDGEGAAALLPSDGAIDVRTEGIGQKGEDIRVVDGFAEHGMTRSCLPASKAACGALLFPVVHGDKNVVWISTQRDIVRGDGVNHVAQARAVLGVVMKHGAIGEVPGCHKLRQCLRGCYGSVRALYGPLKLVYG